MPKRRSKSPSLQTKHDAPPVRTLRLGGDGPTAWVVAIGLALLVGVVYGLAIKTPFIFDDFGAIIGNESITALWPPIGIAKPGPLNPPPELPTSGRPLVNLSFALNYYFSGLNPLGYHVVNLVLHFCAAMLVWAIMRRTLRLPYFSDEFDKSAGWLALAVAILWALHPLQTEAVIYVTQRTELMMALLYLLTLYFSLRFWDSRELKSDNGNTTAPHNNWLALAVFSCAGGMASKEVMVSAPLIVLFFERTFLAGSLANALRRSWPLYIGLASTWILLLAFNIGSPHRDAAGFSVGVSGYAWWLTQCKVLFLYLKLVVWPAPLLIHYQLPYLTSITSAWMYAVPVLLLGIATLVLLWRNTPLGFLGTCVFAILSPTLVIPIVTEMAAERRMYLALFPLVAITVVGGYRLAEAVLQRRKAGSASDAPANAAVAAIGLPAAILVFVYCFVSGHRLLAYDNEVNLWMQVLQFQPDNYMARQSIGSYLERSGEESAAIEQYREATRHNPDASLAHYSLAVLLSKRGAHDEAAVHFAEAVRIIPKNAVLRNNLAFALFMAGRNEEAIDAFRETIALDSKYWPSHKNLGAAQQKVGRFQESIDSFETALKLNPKAIEIYSDLANSYLGMKQKEKAISMLELGLELARAAGDTASARKFTAAMAGQQ